METTTTAGRGVLGRLVVVVAVIAGLTLLAAPMCADGTTMVMPAAPAAAVVHLSDSGDTAKSAEHHQPGPASGYGMLAGCLALLLALAGFAVALRRSQARSPRPPAAAITLRIRSTVGWPTDLSQLCVLRT